MIALWPLVLVALLLCAQPAAANTVDLHSTSPAPRAWLDPVKPGRGLKLEIDIDPLSFL